MTNTNTPLLVIVGGFLGAGKTTALLAATERLQRNGLHVAIMTNDQGRGLVDTALGKGVAGAVAEIPDGCFCCRFAVFEQTLQDLLLTAHPDVVLAEAVGSCADLAATVYQPLRQISTVGMRLGPLSVVVDGKRLHDLVRLRALPRLPTTVSYLYDRQMAEADLFLLNKIDLLSGEERSRVEDYLLSTYPGIPVLPVSAASGRGLDAWIARYGDAMNAGQHVLDIDYDRYAEAEACLGWLNLGGTLTVDATSGAAWVDAFLHATRDMARSTGTEIAHLKVWLETPGGTVRGNLVATDQDPVVIAHEHPAGEAEVLVNVRAATAPDVLRSLVEQAMTHASNITSCPFTRTSIAAFSPARPVPVYRLLPLPS